MSLSDQTKLCFLFLLTHPHMTALGAMRATTQGLAAELRWDSTVFDHVFAGILDNDMAEHDSASNIVAIPNFLRYNPPESPNVIKAWVFALDQIPEGWLKNRVLARAATFAKSLSTAFANALPEEFEKAWLNNLQSAPCSYVQKPEPALFMNKNEQHEQVVVEHMNKSHKSQYEQHEQPVVIGSEGLPEGLPIAFPIALSKGIEKGGKNHPILDPMNNVQKSQNTLFMNKNEKYEQPVVIGSEGLPEGLPIAFPIALSKGMPNQEQEQEPVSQNHRSVQEAGRAVALPGVVQAGKPDRTKQDKPEPSGFTQFWAAWPKGIRKVGRSNCLKLWTRHNAEASSAIIIAHVNRLKASDDWKREGGQYIPLPATYLNQQRWSGCDLDLGSAEERQAEALQSYRFRAGNYEHHESGYWVVMRRDDVPDFVLQKIKIEETDRDSYL